MYRKIAANRGSSFEIWMITKLLSRGSFGIIYETSKCDKTEGKTENFVAKICNSNGVQHIDNEKEVYSTLRRCSQLYTTFLPRIEQYGEKFIILERLDTDVKHFFTSEMVSKKTIHSLIVQIISALEFLHSFGYSHGDIKTENMLLDLKEPEIPRLKMTDLGLALPFNSTQISVQPHRGTLLFISEDAHRGIVPNKRSDLENLGWTIIYSFFNIHVPWKNIRRKSSILKEKVNFKQTIQNNVHNIPGRLKLYFDHIFSLSYDEKPKYNMLKSLFS